MKRFIQFSIAIVLLGMIAFNEAFAQGSLVLNDKLTNAPVLFQIYVEKEGENESIKICREGQPDDSCQVSSRPLMGNYDLTSFKTLCLNLIKSKWSHNLKPDFEIDPVVINRMALIYETWRTNSVENTIRYLQSDQPAGVLVLESDEIPLFLERTGPECSLTLEQREEKALEAIEIDGETDLGLTLKVSSVAFTISDNFISTVSIEGKIMKDGQVVENRLITNFDWSLPLRNNQGQSIVLYKYPYKAKEKNKKDKEVEVLKYQEYKLCYCHLFKYKPHPQTGAFTFYVKDDVFVLKPGESKVLTKRNLDDYIGINITSDFLGLNTNNANNLLITEINAVLPLTVSQYRSARWFPFASARVSFGVVDGVNGRNELLPVLENKKDSLLYIDYFDLVRYQNINTDLYLGLRSYEFKHKNIVLHVGFGSEFYRTGLQHKIIKNGADSIINFSAFSATPYLRFITQWRPDKNFGADLKFDFLKRMWLMNFDNQAPRVLDSNGVYDDDGNQSFIPIENRWQRRLFSTELDLYAHVGGKAGLFARLGMDVSRLKPGRNIFPRILVGYSTNLDAYINKDPGK